jgi:hypothetical protein
MGLLLLILSVVGAFVLIFYIGYYVFGIFVTPFLALHSYFTANNAEDKKEARKLLWAIAFFFTMITILTWLVSAN